MKKTTLHTDRRHGYNALILVAAFLACIIALASCSPRNGCRATRGMAGYSWLKCKQTRLVLVTDNKQGDLVCSYYEPVNK